ncbi:MAG TPA: FliA/WhiG family RNA polymerase sigma factor [Acidimicrobiales bacterium]|nr:FliA/WhiG family RNA polymerase sigma factor [Acidimicrobiales bacterium]
MTNTRNTEITGDASASEDALVREHLPLVRRAVADLSARMPRHAPRDDLMSAGLVGLAQAARNFDSTLGVPFHRYAATRVKGALLDELRANDWASRPVRAKARHMELASEKLMAKFGRMPSQAELAEAMGVDASAVHGLTSDLHRATVLNYDSMLSSGDSDAVLLVDDDTPELELLERERNAYLVDAIRSLPERLQVVVRGYFFEDRSMQHIGAELGVSESRVSQLRAEALDLLKDGINSQLDPTAMGETPNPTGRVARRKAAYFAAIAASSTSAARLDSQPRRLAV